MSRRILFVVVRIDVPLMIGVRMRSRLWTLELLPCLKCLVPVSALLLDIIAIRLLIAVRIDVVVLPCWLFLSLVFRFLLIRGGTAHFLYFSIII